MAPSWTPRLPISFQAGVPTQPQDPKDLPAVSLQVVAHPDEQGPAFISQGTAERLGIAGSSSAAVGLADGSDCVLPVAVAADGSIADGKIACTTVQQYNLHLGAGIHDNFRAFMPPAGEPFDLVDLEAEVALLVRATPDQQPVQVDARQLTREFLRYYFGAVLALNEACVLVLGGHRLLLRVTGANTLDAEAQEEQLAYHCYRGRLTHDTQIYLHTAGQLDGAQRKGPSAADATQRASGSTLAAEPAAMESAAVAAAAAAAAAGAPSQPGSLPQSMAAARGSVTLLNARQRPAAGPSCSTVIVHTSDGEWFPVKRRLLRPCIALTRAVRSEEEGSPEVTVDVDCLTFDRVLIFLEALALDRQPPNFGLHLCGQLLAAAQHLGLRALEEYCQERLGESHSRLRFYSFEEVKGLNAVGGCWLILDGMVLDVTRWLPEHPGGSKIIPRQSLNLDCSRFFELYHASRESFIYLRQFYHGEILPEERGAVPAPAEPPSAEFMQQLREFTPWRLGADEAGEPAAAATRTHLGAKRAAPRAGGQ